MSEIHFLWVNVPHPHDIGKPAIYLVSAPEKLEFQEMLLGRYNVLVLMQTFKAEITHTEEEEYALKSNNNKTVTETY